MAILKFGALVVDGKGKIGGQVLQGSKGGTMLRTKKAKWKAGKALAETVKLVVQKNRNNFNTVVKNWTELNVNEKEAWDSLLGVWTFQNKFGDTVNLNNYAIFTAVNINRLQLGQPILTAPPVADSVFSPGYTITIDPVTHRFELETSNASANGQLLVVSQHFPVSINKAAPSDKGKKIVTTLADNVLKHNMSPFMFGLDGMVVGSDFSIFFSVWTCNAAYPRVRQLEMIKVQVTNYQVAT